MRLLVKFFYYCIPHFSTFYYLRGTDEDGEKVRIFIDDPEGVDREMQPYIHVCRVLVLLGIPLFPRISQYQFQ